MSNNFKTEVISASVSKEFAKMIDEYNLSPTDIFRKGMAVCLYELDIERYQTETNKKRVEYTKAFMAEYEQNQKLIKLFNEIASFAKVLEEHKNDK